MKKYINERMVQMKNRSMGVLVLALALVISLSTGIRAQDELAVFVVYGVMYADQYGTPVGQLIYFLQRFN